MKRGGLLLLWLTPCAWGGDVRVRVLELFHPAEARLSAPQGLRVRLETAGGIVTLEGSQSYRATLGGGRVSAKGGPVHVRLEGQIARTYPGALEIEPQGGELRIIAELPLEQAVAAIVAAEAGRNAPLEAQKAQAIAARSFLLAAQGRHGEYAFCDTTHCHHLTEADERSETAARSTAGVRLVYGGEIVEALSTRRCGGTTRTLSQIGLDGGGYPYFAAACAPCRRRPFAWKRSWPAKDVAAVAARPGMEAARLEAVRVLGWSAIPSNDYVVDIEGDEARLAGRGEGHGVGLCQLGAAELARQGWDAQRILALYFLNAAVER